MKDNLKNFGKNIKTYVKYIATLGFKDLGVHFLSLLFLIFISLLMYVPVSLVEDFLVTIISGIGNVPIIIYTILNIIMELISLFAAFYVFIFMFNQRYTEVYVNEMNGNNKKVKEEVNVYSNKVDNNIELPELDLPKKK